MAMTLEELDYWVARVNGYLEELNRRMEGE